MKYTIKLTDELQFSEEEFFLLCTVNRKLRLERDEFGNIIILPLDDLNSSVLQGKLLAALSIWNDENKAGKALDSNGGITLPDGSVRAADVAFIPNGKTK